MSSDSTGKLVCCSICGFFLGLGMIGTGVKNYQFAQRVKNTPTSKVAAAAVGLVELYGKAKCLDDKTKAELDAKLAVNRAKAEEYIEKLKEGKEIKEKLKGVTALAKAGQESAAGGALLSPVTKARCVYWRVTGEYYQSGKHGGWRDICDHHSYSSFFLEDDTGKVLVDPVEAQVDIPYDKVYDGYMEGKGMFGVPHTQLDPQAVEYIKNLPESYRSRFMAHQHHDLRVHEYFIAERDEVYVMGNAEPREGVSSAVAHENLVVKKGAVDKLMYITDSSEKKVLDKFGGNTYWQIFGGLAISAVSLLILLGIAKV